MNDRQKLLQNAYIDMRQVYPSLTKDKIARAQAMLYAVNTSNQCVNPPHPSWYRGYQNWKLNYKNKKP